MMFSSELTLRAMKVSDRIRNLRRLRNLSQENLATELGLDYSTYNSYEKDSSKIQIKTLEKIVATNQKAIYFIGSTSLGSIATAARPEKTALKFIRACMKDFVEYLK